MSRRFGAALDLTATDAALRERFWSKVAIGADDECWEWTAHRKAHGYGQFTVTKGNFQIASRVAVALTVRAIRSADVSHFGNRTALARQYGISFNSLMKVIHGRTWRDVA